MIVHILGRNGKPVHDGVGGKHAVGSIVELPDDVASVLIASGSAAPAGDDGAIQIKKRAIERADEMRQAQQKARSAQAMSVHDSLPPEVRQAVHEHGDEVTEAYLAGLDQQDGEPEKPRLNRKQRRALRQTDEGDA